MLGVPATHKGWMSAYGENLDFPREGKATKTCAHSGDIYTLEGVVVTREEASR